jgi:hypothetical protein
MQVQNKILADSRITWTYNIKIPADNWAWYSLPLIKPTSSLPNCMWNCRKLLNWQYVYKYHSSGKGKITPVPKHPVIKIYRQYRIIAVYIPDLSIRWTWVVSFLQQGLYLYRIMLATEEVVREGLSHRNDRRTLACQESHCSHPASTQ